MRDEGREVTELRRALWRMEHGQLSPLRMRRLLAVEYRRAAGEFSALAASAPAVRRLAPALLAARDVVLSRADRALKAAPTRHREALDEVVRGRGVLQTMRALVEASTRADGAAEACGRLHSLARVPRLRTLPCVDTPARLLALAREHLARGQYAQALYLADSSLAQSSAVARRERDDPGTAAELRTRLRALHALCEETRDVAGEAAAAMDAGTLEAALALVDGGWLALALRVADELAFLLAARERFHRELRGSGEDASLLRQAASAGRGEGAEPWASATSALWRSRVEAGLRRLADQRERLDRAGARLGDRRGPAPPPP